MHKLVNVLRVRELEPGDAVERELALITISAAPERRAELMALTDVFNARVADVGPRASSSRWSASPRSSTPSRSSSARTASASSSAPAVSACAGRRAATTLQKVNV